MAFRKLGEFIKLVDIRNSEGNISNLLGVSISKEFMPSVANIIGTDLTKYKIISKGQFACSLMQVSRDGGIAISLYKNAESAIMSPAYFIFEVSNSQLNSDYLELIFNTSEFDRAATFYAVGGVRGTLTWDDFCKMEINVPDIAEQERVVKIYNVINNRIKILNALNKNLEEQAQTIFKHWFIDFEFPNEEGQPYKSSGGKMIWNEELQKEIPEDWKSGKLGEICRIFTGKKNANASVIDGKYKFFTCSPNPLYINSYIYDGEAIIISGNGAYTGRTKFYSGKFDLYQRTYACTIEENRNYLYILYWLIQSELIPTIMGGTRGTAIPYIVLEDLSKFSFCYNEKIYNKLSLKFKSVMDFILNNEKEQEKLTELRDLLLPKLLS